MKPCDKLNELCSKAHMCEKLCHEPCGKCSIKINAILPCGHESNQACSTDISTVKCPRKCEKICPQCQKRCFKVCWEDCNPCTHKVRLIFRALIFFFFLSYFGNIKLVFFSNLSSH